MHLRSWQSRCVNRALRAYRGGQRHFLSVATPGAGKTVMASALANRLFKADQIDLVICLTPSQVVKASFTRDLTDLTRLPMTGEIGSKGCVITYQALGYLTQHFWQLFDHFRVFVIFDEIHHCGGAQDKPGNTWGEAIFTQIHDRACYTLSLSGTPWRSDDLPVVFANYVRPDGRLKPDFVYSLREAIEDGVCRIPQIVVIDNNGIEVRRAEKGEHPPAVYGGIQQLFDEEELPYQALLENEQLLSHVLERSVEQLKHVQRTSPQAAGLIIASNVEHARTIHYRLVNDYAQSATLVTHKTANAAEQLLMFNMSNENWIVSVGMVSEGTNIPRLQVCCHLSRVKTELHFRQVLGRILRNTDSIYERAYMFVLADVRLVQYAQRIAEDLPGEATIVSFESGPSMIEFGGSNQEPLLQQLLFDRQEEAMSVDQPVSVQWNESSNEHLVDGETEVLPPVQNERVSISLFGQFMEELIALQAEFRSS